MYTNFEIYSNFNHKKAHTHFADFKHVIIKFSHFSDFEQVIIKISHFAEFEQVIIKFSLLGIHRHALSIYNTT